MPARVTPARVPLVATVTAAVACLLAPAASADGRVGPCPVFPSESPWNQRVDHLPVLPESDAMVRRMGADSPLHPDFGSGRWRGGRIGIPYTTVGRRQRRVPVRFGASAAYSDPGPYPIPRNAPVEAPVRNPDRHVVVVNKAECRLYELYRAFRRDRGRRWSAEAGAAWDLRSAQLRPDGWTSADAAGLPIFPGLVRYPEVRGGAIEHAMRLAVPATRRSWIYPARHSGSSLTDPALPAPGQRLRLKASVDAEAFPPQARVVVRALQRYGVLVSDSGAPWHLSGAPSRGWRMSQVYSLMDLRGRDFEVVDTGSLPRP